MLIVACSFFVLLFAILLAVALVLSDKLALAHAQQDAQEAARVRARIEPPPLLVPQVIPVIMIGDTLSPGPVALAAAAVLAVAEDRKPSPPAEAEHDAWAKAGDGMAGYEAPFGR